MINSIVNKRRLKTCSTHTGQLKNGWVAESIFKTIWTQFRQQVVQAVGFVQHALEKLSTQQIAPFMQSRIAVSSTELQIVRGIKIILLKSENVLRSYSKKYTGTVFETRCSTPFTPVLTKHLVVYALFGSGLLFPGHCSNPCIYITRPLYSGRIGLGFAAWLQAKVRVCGLGQRPTLTPTLSVAHSSAKAAHAAYDAKF